MNARVTLLKPEKGTDKSSIENGTLLLPYPCSNQDCTPYKVILNSGLYLFELWGASGGVYIAGKEVSGAYVSGYISLRRSRSFLVYCGGKGEDGIGGLNNDAFNGGGSGYLGGGAGGGATDIRLDTSLESRIMVAGGSGGGDGNNFAGVGGTLKGGDPRIVEAGSYDGTGATQTSGGNGNPKGEFGKGGSGAIDGAGGGGGYYGGGHGYNGYGTGGGGSSFISGHQGCNAIVSSTDRTPSNQPIHYSKLRFFRTIMVDGYSYMPKPGNTLESSLGCIGYGYARITSITSFNLCMTCYRRGRSTVNYIITIIVLLS